MTEQENDKKCQELNYSLGRDLINKIKIMFDIFIDNNNINIDDVESIITLSGVLANVFYESMESSIKKEGHLLVMNLCHDILMKVSEEEKK